MKNTLEEILMDVRHGRSLQSVFIYANDESKSALARDLGDCRDNKGKLAKRVFTCLQEIPMELPVKKMDTNGTQNTYSKIVRQEIGL